MKAYLFLMGLLGSKIKLVDINGYEFTTNKDDLEIWNELLVSKTAQVEIEKGLFKITPLDRKFSTYFVAGNNFKINYPKKRFNEDVLKYSYFQVLQNSEKSIYSQHGEDGVIEKLFSYIPAESHTNFIIEFGAHDGIKMSNSRFLIEKKWNAFLIEADQRLFKKLKKVYPLKGEYNQQVKILNSFVTVENINQLFLDAKVPKDFSVLSIDVDGIDYYLWEKCEFKPALVIIECNPIIPPDQTYVVSKEKAYEYSGTSKEGASFKSLVQLGKQKNYSLVYVELVGSNLFFLRNDLLKYIPNFEIIPFEKMYQTPQFGVLTNGLALNGRGYLN